MWQLIQIFLDMFQPEKCDICYEYSNSFSTCPYFDKHKWCEDCDSKMKPICPFCNRSFERVQIFGFVSEIFSEPIYINRRML